MGVINCDLDETPFCSGGVRYCCVSYMGGTDYRACGTCTPAYRLSLYVPSSFYAGQSVTVSGQLFLGTTPVPNTKVQVWFDYDNASWVGRLGAYGGEANTDAYGNYSITIPAWQFIITADMRPLPRGWSFRATCSYCQSEVVLNTEQGTMVNTVLDITSITPASVARGTTNVVVVGTLKTTSGVPLVNFPVSPFFFEPTGMSQDSVPEFVYTNASGIWTFTIPAAKIGQYDVGTWYVGAHTDSIAVGQTLYNGAWLDYNLHTFVSYGYCPDGIPESECDYSVQTGDDFVGDPLCDRDGKHLILTQTDTCNSCYVWDGTYCGTGCVPGTKRNCVGGILNGQETCIASGNETVWDTSTCKNATCLEGLKRGETVCSNGSKIYAEICHGNDWQAIFPREACPNACTVGQFDTSKQTLCPDLVTLQQHSICQLTDNGNKWVPFTPPACPTCGETHPQPGCEDDGYIYDCVNNIWTKTTTPCCKTTHPNEECIAGEKWDCNGESWEGTGFPCGGYNCIPGQKPPECIDGFIWDCVNQTWERTDERCGTPPVDTLLYLAIGGAAIAGIAGAAMLFGKKGRK